MERKICTCVPASVILALSLLDWGEVGLRSGCPLWMRFAYPFLHGNVFHALANLYVLWQCFCVMRVNKTTLLLFYIAAISYPFAGDTPIIGLSGIAFAYIGYLLPYVVDRFKFCALSLLFIALGAIIPNLAAGLHLHCYIIGIAIGYLNAPLWRER